MKLTSLYCPCQGGEVPPDHYASGTCTKPPAPLPWLLAMQHRVTTDGDHAGNRMTATRLAECPRATAIRDNLPIPAYNLMRSNAQMFGTAVHEFMAKWAPPGYLSEVALAGVLFKGTPYEVEVRGTADVIKPGALVIEDYKTTSEWSQKWRTEHPNESHEEWSVQVSVYNLLAPLDKKATRAAVWSGAIVGKKSKALPWVEMLVRCDMTEEEILAVRPHGGKATVAEHLAIRGRFLADLAGGTDARAAVARLPLTGADCEDWICSYCVVDHVCAALPQMAAEGGIE